ncbi:inositol monophosphatase family protein [Actinotignum timonense]|uniref:inositol monophosphatase family protein n=1 Tax=Actinotignum timonense TaxID=1870995 RepID=UPI002A837237|nr:inositol monophosphatase family protein [Actinotignum timonense]MDY5142025.1 inositol monophosphatase family protein [Actinotignum timonense]
MYIKDSWWASRGGGAWLSENGGEPQRLRVSDIDRMDRAAFGFSSLSSWDETGRMATLIAFARATWGTRAYGAFWPYMLLAEGAFDIAAQPGLDVYDMAALVPIVEEAGGTFTSLEGKPGPWWGSALVTNGKLHAAAQAIINETHVQPGSRD